MRRVLLSAVAVPVYLVVISGAWWSWFLLGFCVHFLFVEFLDWFFRVEITVDNGRES